MESETLKNYIDHSYGFAIPVGDVEFFARPGHLRPKIDAKTLQEKLWEMLRKDDTILTGAHVKIIRLTMEMTMQDFGDMLGVSRQAVFGWEKCDQESVRMSKTATILLKKYCMNRR